MRTETLALGIYVLAAGVVALAVPQAQKIQSTEWIQAETDPNKWTEDLKALKKKGEEGQNRGDGRTWQYTSAAFDHWWSRIETANWIGRLPKVEVEEQPKEIEKPEPKPVVKPLEEIFSIALMLAGDEGRLKIHYKDPSVQPPKVPDSNLAAPMPNLQAQGDPMGKGTGIYQDLSIGDSLYEPFASIRFEGFADGGATARFSRSVPGSEERREDRMMIAELETSSGSFGDPESVAAGGSSGASKSESIPYRDPGRQTSADPKTGVVYVSRNDAEVFRKDPNRVINEDIVGTDWDPPESVRKARGYKGGVEVRSVSKTMRSFGIQPGMILIKLNGVPVTSRANAMKVGRRQYDAGTRTFNATFIDNGAEVVKTYRAPDK